MTRLLAWLRALWKRREIRATVDEELAFHVEMEADAHRRHGDPPDEARRHALAEFGPPSFVRAEILDVRTPWLGRFTSGVLQDTRYALRSFSRTPLAMASVVIVLAVGIGLTSAVFSAVDALFFRSLPVPNADRMVYITAPGAEVDIGAFKDAAQGAIRAISPTQWTGGLLSNDDLHVRANGELVGPAYFAALGLRPELGRFFLQSDADPGDADWAVVVSDDLWQSRLSGNSAVVGLPVQLMGRRAVVIGVAPPGFRGVALPWRPSEFWVVQRLPPPFRQHLAQSAIARLSGGANAQALAAAVNAHATNGEPATTNHAEISIRPAVGLLTTQADLASLGFVRALADAVAVMALVVMLIAAGNVVGILMARGVARSTELAVRQALGADASRLARQLVTESLLLGMAAGAAGLFVAWMLIHVYRAWAPFDVALDLEINARVLGWTLLACTLAGLGVGAAPMRQALHVDVLAWLGAPGATIAAPRARRLRYGAVMPQMALSIALLIVAGAHARALALVEQANPGYEVDHVIAATLRLPPSKFNRNDPAQAAAAAAANVQFIATVLERLRGQPGVSAAAAATVDPSGAVLLPFHPLTARDSSGRETSVVTSSSIDAVSADFFAAESIPLLQGRTFDDKRDRPDTPPVAIVSASLARQIEPDGRALGRLVQVVTVGKTSETAWREVVGIVGDIKNGDTVVPMVYEPTTQLNLHVIITTIVRVNVDAEAAVPMISHALASIDSRAQLDEAMTLRESIARAHFVRRLTLALVGVAGIFGVVLAAIGLYSAVSYSVAQQARGLAVRVTLGATGRDLSRLVLWDGVRSVLIALAPGICLGLVAFRLTAAVVRYVTGPVAAPDGIVIAAVALLVGAVAIVACLLPARRAATADPLAALRGD